MASDKHEPTTGKENAAWKEDKKSLRESEHRFRMLFEKMAQGVVYQNACGQITQANPAAEKTLGLTLEQMQGRTSLDYRWHTIRDDGSDFPGNEHPAIEALRTGKPVYNVVMGVFHPGKNDYVWILVNAEPEFRNGEKKPFQVFTTFTDITKQRQSEKELRFHNRLQELLVGISNTYINLPASQLDCTIKKSLRELGEFVGADRFYLFDYDFVHQTCSNTYEWCAEGIEPQIALMQNVPMASIPGWVEAHQRGENICVPDVFALPANGGLRLILEPQGIKSLLAVPMMDGDRCVGFAGFDAVKTHHRFSEPEYGLLKVFTQMLVSVKKRLQIENELRQSEEKYRSLIDSSDAAIIMVDASGHYLYVNEIAAQPFGLTPKQMTERRLPDLLPNDTRQIMANVARVIAENKGIVVEEEVTIAGEKRWYRTSIQPVRNEAGVPFAALLYATNITEKKLAELKLRQSEKNYKSLFFDSPDSYLLFREGRFIECNKASEAMLRGDRSLIVGSTPAMISPVYQHNGKTSEEYAAEVVHQAMANGRHSFEWVHKRFDGTEFLARINLSVIVYENLPTLFVTWQDITLQWQAEEELRKFQTICAQANYGITTATLDGVLLYANEAFAAMHGWQASDIVGKKLSMLHTQEQMARVMEMIHLLQARGEFKAEEVWRVRKDGSIFPSLMNAILIYDNNNRPQFMAATAVDITERKAGEQALRDSEERLHYAQEIAHMGSWDFNLATGEMKCSKSYYKLIERENDGQSLTNDTFLQIVHPDDRQLIDEARTKIMESKAPTTIEVRLMMPDGRSKWVLKNIAPKFYGGKLVSLSGVNIDITEQKLRENEIRELNANLEQRIEARTRDLLKANAKLMNEICMRQEIERALKTKTDELETFFTVALDLLCIADTDGNFLKVNKSWENILGYSQKELEQRKLLEFIHLDDIPSTLEAIAQLREQKSVIGFINRCTTKNGDYRFIEWRSVPVGKLIYAAARDITERKKLEDELLMAKEAAEAANKAKSVFLSNMSHEIRTPLNAIIGFSQILKKDSSLSTKQIEQIQIISRSGEHLLSLINDILDISKIEAGQIILNPADFRLHDLLNDLQMMFSLRCKDKGLQIVFECQESIPKYVAADEAKLRQIFINLLSNAVKFTRTGGIAVRARAEAIPDDLPEHKGCFKLMVEIEDSGCGISDEDQKYIFEPFFQSKEGMKEGGTGLGLSICRNLVELMGGKIRVQSQVGKGSIFRFHVPVKLARRTTQIRICSLSRQIVGVKEGTGPFRILIVDDKRNNLDLLRAILEPIGFEIKEAADGKEAVMLFERWCPHAVLMDLRMPGMDGYEATRLIKATARGQATHVIAVTATVFECDEKTARAVDFDGYIRKPFRPEEVYEILRKSLGLQYVFAEDGRSSIGKTYPLTHKDLSVLPDSLIQSMRQAIEQGNMARLRGLIAQAEKVNPHVAHGLQSLAKQYDYEKLNALLKPE